MNAGTDYYGARKQAQANADRTQTPRWLHGYAGVWWISREPITDAERIDPTRQETYTTEEHCQYCGNRWTQTRTVGTPRLDSVRCPSCGRLV